MNIYKTAYNYSDYTTGDNYTAADGTDPYYAIDQVFGGGNQADYAPENGAANSTKKAVVHVYGCDNTVRRVFGGGNAAAATGIQTIIDGGRYDYVFGGGNGETSAANIGAGGTDLQVHGGNIRTLFGGSNTSGTITGQMRVSVDAVGGCGSDMYVAEFFCGNNLAPIGTQANPTNIVATIGCGTKFGDVYGGCNLADIYGNVTMTIVGGEMNNVYAGSKGRLADNTDPSNPIAAQAADIHGNTTLNIYGGKIGSAFGGSNINGNISGSIDVVLDWSQASSDCNTENDLSIGYIYGASNLATYTPTDNNNHLRVNINHGTVTHSVFGGGKGSSAVVTSNPVVTIGDNNSSHSAIVTENVYGGGDAAAVTGNTTVTYNDANTSSQVANLFGGGNQAGVSGTATVSLTSGKVTTGIYGGCNTSGTVGGNIVVTLLGGTVGASGASTKANVHGGGYGSATATSGNVTVNIGTKSGTTYSGTATIYGDVYGGSALGSVNTNTSNTTQVNLYHGTIHGDAYGGGLGDANNAAAVNGNVTVTLDGAAFVLTTTSDDQTPANSVPTSGRVFGCNNVNGSPQGTVLVHVLKTVAADGSAHANGAYEVEAVYGGGNLAAYQPANPRATGPFTSYTFNNAQVAHSATEKPVQVVVDACDEASIRYVYGGGNAAPAPATDALIIGCYEIERVFGGGNGKDRIYTNGGWAANPGADVGVVNGINYGSGEALASVVGGTVHYVFGGSNTRGNVVTSAEVFLDEASDCPLHVGEIYGGGNEAYMKGDSKIVLGCIDYLEVLYGGARNADVDGDIDMTITSGHFDRIFGGNNVGGSINGSITLNIEETGCHPITIGELYGCGNNAAYTTPTGKSHPTINIKSFTSIGRVFGGGLGSGATVTGDPTLNINVVMGDNAGNTTWSHNGATINYHDDDTNPSTVTSTVTLPLHASNKMGAIGTVFGGGNAAAVDGNTNVNICTEQYVYFVVPASSITVGTTDVSSYYTRTGSGTTADPYVYSATAASSTAVAGTTYYERKTVLGADIRNNVFGGGNQAKVTGDTNVVVGR